MEYLIVEKDTPGALLAEVKRLETQGYTFFDNYTVISERVSLFGKTKRVYGMLLYRAEPEVEGLRNAGFEDSIEQGVIHPGNDTGVFHDNILTPEGWVTWWRTGENSDGQELGQPEVNLVHGKCPVNGYDADLPRLCEGQQAVHLFTTHWAHACGLYQVVHGLEPGQPVALWAQAQGWTCGNDGTPEKPLGYTCEHEFNQIAFSVGIEPNGLADPWADSVKWSQEQIAPDAFELIGPANAVVGDEGCVTVVLCSRAKWAYKHNDCWWDDVRLEIG